MCLKFRTELINQLKMIKFYKCIILYRWGFCSICKTNLPSVRLDRSVWSITLDVGDIVTYKLNESCEWYLKFNISPHTAWIILDIIFCKKLTEANKDVFVPVSTVFLVFYLEYINVIFSCNPMFSGIQTLYRYNPPHIKVLIKGESLNHRRFIFIKGQNKCFEIYHDQN